MIRDFFVSSINHPTQNPATDFSTRWVNGEMCTGDASAVQFARVARTWKSGFCISVAGFILQGM